jgi:hypothetical protein
MKWSGRAGAGHEINGFPNTTPSARNKEASRILITPRIHSSSAEEGNTLRNPVDASQLAIRFQRKAIGMRSAIQTAQSQEV